MCPQLQHLTVLASHADPFSGSSYAGDDVWGTEEGHHRLAFWDEQQVVLEGDTVLAHLLLRRAVLGKGKTPSIESSIVMYNNGVGPKSLLNKYHSVFKKTSWYFIRTYSPQDRHRYYTLRDISSIPPIPLDHPSTHSYSPPIPLDHPSTHSYSPPIPPRIL